MSDNPGARAQAAQPGEGQSSWFTEWSRRTPLVARSTLIALVSCTLIGWLTGAYAFLSNLPASVIFGFEIWRLLTYAFFDASFMSLLFSVMSFSQSGPALEIRMGSAGLLVLLAYAPSPLVFTGFSLAAGCFLTAHPPPSFGWPPFLTTSLGVWLVARRTLALGCGLAYDLVAFALEYNPIYSTPMYMMSAAGSLPPSRGLDRLNARQSLNP